VKRAATVLVFSAAATLLLYACGEKQVAPAEGAGSASALAAPAKATPQPRAAPFEPAPPPPVAGNERSVPAGTVNLGSETGSARRNPAHEADHVASVLNAFQIDALPYPNDPGKPPMSAVTRDEASALCTGRGQRLCSELEWERACKGEQDAVYPDRKFDAARCAKQATSCVSAFGVFALGTLGREWTSSDAAGGEWDGLRTAVVRGAARDAPEPAHRCAARDAATPKSRSDSLIFRCCRGPAQTAVYPAIPDQPPFRDSEPDAKTLAAALATMPETRDVAAKFRTWSQSELAQALSQAGRSQSSLAPWQAVRGSLGWSPVRGEQVVIASGDTPRGALVVAYYPLPRGPRFAGSYETKGEHTPVLVAYKSDVRDELLFSTCWGCGGEGGAIRLDDTARLRFLPR